MCADAEDRCFTYTYVPLNKSKDWQDIFSS
jgi:hypothetical protein